MIGDLSKAEFVAILHNHVSPTSPIQSEEHLFGREKQLRQVEQALHAPGRSVFIYGDRGVGKTSLAQTVAFSQQSAMANPVLLACQPGTTFGGIMTTTLAQLRESRAKTGTTTTRTLKLGYNGFGIDTGQTKQETPIPPFQAIENLNEIVTALLEAALERKNESLVVVVDEFDRITSDEERTHFADFIKQIGDQRIPIKFVFCGVAESLQKLLGAHGSCYRYIDNVELGTLSYDARFEIIQNVANALNVVVDDRPRHRIAAISDGFPHYIHRMCEHLFWQMFDDPLPCKMPTVDHYRAAVAQSVLGIEQHLKVTYDQAIMKDAVGYEHILWAVADHGDLIRKTDAIYSSYVDVMNHLDDGEEDMLAQSTVVTRLNALKGKSYGAILTSGRKGYYQFRESIMRGYVRLRAEEQGCELALDYAAASRLNPELISRMRPARRGRVGTSPKDRRKMEYPN